MATGSPNSGAAKKKRKKNRNNQNNQNFMSQFTNNFNAPPLPPPEDLNSIPKPEPPPEILPPLPPENPPLPSLPKDVPMQEEQNKAPAPPLPTQRTLQNGENPADDWPQSLKDYVHNCYSKCKTTIDKNQVEIILKGKITAAYQSGQLHKDWSLEPLPSIHSETQAARQQAVQVPKFTGQAKISTGILAQFQNAPKKGISAALGARLGGRNTFRDKDSNSSRSKSRSPRRGRSLSRSRSRSRSRSPRRHKKSSSSSDSSNEDYKTPTKIGKKNKLADRLGPQKGKPNNKLNKKQKMKEKKASFYQSFGQDVEENSEVLQQRAARFNNAKNGGNGAVIRYKIDLGESNSNDLDWTGVHIIGTCQDIEKSFLRLTKAPEASDVRPVEVLRRSLANIKEKWLEKQDYYYACDQLKSIRQDLTVQGIRNEFTVQVYETHARIALEKGDHEEFNQCQTQLKALYNDIGGQNRNEFVAYRILYFIFTKNTLDIMTILKSLPKEDKLDSSISFALKVRSAWGSGNFHKFFSLYLTAPLMAGFLIDWFIERERKAYLKCIIKSYRQTINVEFLTKEFAFKTVEECVEFLDPFGLVFTDEGRKFIDCKNSMSSLGNF
ncbi:hypothetical protein GWI33_000574 [Rhynchophorus ferrugineus]|uniref:PCI domain-containing protein n=1 Tax=Rhynchophorus ferrugineus TaxID=354439 RepID=A0A834ILT9_RHYFE|nr:hypothetical protein GWI33_000574 [Rhynchophorus ferrugineus]